MTKTIIEAPETDVSPIIPGLTPEESKAFATFEKKKVKPLFEQWQKVDFHTNLEKATEEARWAQSDNEMPITEKMEIISKSQKYGSHDPELKAHHIRLTAICNDESDRIQREELLPIIRPAMERVVNIWRKKLANRIALHEAEEKALNCELPIPQMVSHLRGQINSLVRRIEDGILIRGVTPSFAPHVAELLKPIELPFL
jgi:hypothetical protein